VTLVVSRLPEERDALLDAVAARIVPDEGRVWVSHVPVSRDTVRRIRGMVVEADVHARPAEHRSLLWNVLVAGKSGHRALPGSCACRASPSASRRGVRSSAWAWEAVRSRPRPASARSIGRGSRSPASWDDAGGARRAEIGSRLDGAEAATVRALLRSLAHRERLAVLASAATPAAASDSRIASSRSPTVCSSSTARRPTSAVSASPGRFGTA
jgi:hypothetical protein